MTIAVLLASLLLQLLAAGLAFRLIRLTGRPTAWLCLGFGLLLMAVRRAITLCSAAVGLVEPQLETELVALVISSLLLASVIGIAPLIRLLSRNDEIARLTREVARGASVFRGVIDQTFQFIGLMTNDGTLIEANRSSLAAVGMEPGDVLDRPFWETAWWSHSPELQQRLKEAIARAAGGELDRFEASHVRADGSLIYVDFSLKPLRDAAGEVIYLIPEGRDITQLKANETRLLQLNAQLEQTNSELDDFAHIVSHDLKSPLRAIERLAKWVADDAADALPPKSAERLAEISARISQMDQLLDELLAYSRLGANGDEPCRVDLGELVDEIVGLLSIPEQFSIIADEGLPTITTLKAPLAACLRNLIDNALKHHDRDDGVVRISAREQGEFVDVIVADDGPGIDPRFHERIFHIFQTLQPASQRRSSGVGLAYVKKIAASYGGDASVESTLGEGSRFTLRWPRRITAGETIDAAPPPREPSAAAP